MLLPRFSFSDNLKHLKWSFFWVFFGGPLQSKISQSTLFLLWQSKFPSIGPSQCHHYATIMPDLLFVNKLVLVG
jgi:hypothetical protein